MRYFYCISLLLVLAACSSSAEDNTEEPVVENNFHVEGTITGAAMQKVTIEATSQQGPITVAETSTDANGKFSFDGNIPGMGIYTMNVSNDQTKSIVLPIDVNDRITVNASLESFAVSPKISGPRWAKPLVRYMELFNEFAQAQSAQLPAIKDEAKQLEKFNELRKPLDEYVRKQVYADPSNPVNLVFTSSLVPSREAGYANWDPENLKTLKKIEQAFVEKHSDSPMTSLMTQQLAQLEADYANYAQLSTGSIAAPEIAMKNPAGTVMRLSDLKGKVVLVDFWASWCGPCRRENPNVVRLYKELKSQGFEIFSVSLDQDPAAWKAAIQKDGLSWPNHVSDLMGWQSPIVQTYGFNGIPYTVLLNREGNIISVGLRGAELEQKLKAELAKK